jgi:hypothetical protein
MDYETIREIRVIRNDGTTVIYKGNGLEKFKRLVSPAPTPVTSTPSVAKSSSRYASSEIVVQPTSGDIFTNAEALKKQSGLKF